MTEAAIPPQLEADARRWIALDPDPTTRAELDGLLDAGRVDELHDRFAQRLTFGTSGIRGRLGAGPNRMNRLVVRQVAAGLSRWLGAGRTVVVGHDARHGSAAFAAEVADVLSSAAIRVLVLTEPQPTPVLAFAVLDAAADAGVMVTASHNPGTDNGVKVYGPDGSQLLPSDADAVMAAVEAAGRDASGPADVAVAARSVELGPDLIDRYVAAVVDLVERGGPRGVEVVHTALHGVSHDLVQRVFARAGFDLPIAVPEQSAPDPEFPTVSFPNPEEQGALDLALALAERRGADLLLANDPDGDRLAVAVPDRDGRWRVLTGDEVGALLVEHRLRHGSGSDRLVVSTIVSSPLVALLAAEAGVHHVQTLTGFKWIMRPVLDHPEWELALAYEESLGYAVGSAVHDKDGISAGLVFAELVAGLPAAGGSVLDRLDDIARRHGLHANRTWTTRDDAPDGAERLAVAIGRLRARPPTSLAGLPVVAVVDYRDGIDGLPPTDALRFDLAGASRVLIRPSGTEPKLKAYLHSASPVPDGPTGLDSARAAADERLGALARAVAEIVVDTPS
jgi:phosphomannomutase